MQTGLINIPREVGASYGASLRHLWPFTALHLAIRLVVAAILVPLGSALLAAAIATSDQGAVTDQDIVRFLLTPAGFAGALAVVSLLLAGAVLDVAVMTATIRSGAQTARGALLVALRLVLGRLVPLLRFAALFVLRLLLIAAPFLAVAGGIALVAFGPYDINYYLTYRPPDFVAAVAAIAAILLALALVLLRRVSSWSVALHLLMFRRVRPARSFADSAARLRGWKRHTIGLVVVWFLVRWAMTAAATAVAGGLIGGVPGLISSDLRIVAAATIATLLLWLLASTMIGALSNGALAVLLNRLYIRVGGEDAAPAEPPVEIARVPLTALALVLVAAIGAGAILGDRLLDRVAAESDVAVIAHRGAAGTRPENTMAAIEEAVAVGAHWVEIDVQETADGEVVVAHDSDLMKLGGIDLKVWDATADDLARIDIGSWFDPAYADQRTPTLRQALDAARGQSRVIIELKYYGHAVDLEARVAAIVEAAGMAEDVAIMSLSLDGVRRMQALRPGWRHGILAATAIGDLTTLDADFLAVNTGQASLGLVRRAHARGQDVYVWTVDDPVTMSRMISMGVDGLITNQPALAREVIATRNALGAAERLSLWLTDRFRIGSFDLVAPESDA